MKKVHYLDYKSNENMMMLEALKPVQPLKNVILVNSDPIAAGNTIVGQGILVNPGETVEISAYAAIEDGNDGAIL